MLTSRNVNGGLVTDWMMGGLNYQIEHHLFPSMPRANLRFAQPIVQQYCERIGMPYLSTGVIESYRMGLRPHARGRQRTTRPEQDRLSNTPHDELARGLSITFTSLGAAIL